MARAHPSCEVDVLMFCPPCQLGKLERGEVFPCERGERMRPEEVAHDMDFLRRTLACPRQSRSIYLLHLVGPCDLTQHTMPPLPAASGVDKRRVHLLASPPPSPPQHNVRNAPAVVIEECSAATNS